MSKTINILVANGVNLDLLGSREADQYGTFTLNDLKDYLEKTAAGISKLFGVPALKLKFFQSNSEAEYLAEISKSQYDGLLLNPGAWTHTSLALGDRLAALKVPFVEVHISNLASRESVRQQSFSAKHARGVISGCGKYSYGAGLFALVELLVNET